MREKTERTEIHKKWKTEKHTQSEYSSFCILNIDGEWVFQDYFHTVGPMAFKKDILSLDVKSIGKGPVQIKLEAGSYFWEIGFVELSFDDRFRISYCYPCCSGRPSMKSEGCGRRRLYQMMTATMFNLKSGMRQHLVFLYRKWQEKAKDHRTAFKGLLPDRSGSRRCPENKSAKGDSKIREFNVYSNELMQEMLAEHIFRMGKMGKRGE